MSRVARSRLFSGAFLLVLAMVLAACGGGQDSGGGGQGGGGGEETTGGAGTQASGSGGDSGQISIEGSSTVLPITQAAAEAFNRENPDVQISVGGSGTGDGFQAFCNGDTQISDASRPIKDEEAQACEENGINFVELAVALDGLSVVTNPQSPVDEMTLDQLGTLWCPEAEGQIDNLNQVDPSLPNAEVSLYGPGTESGTFDFFTEEVCGEEGESRTDYNPSEDDNVLVQGVSGDPNGLGYFGFSYFVENQQRLKALAIDGVAPTEETIQSGEYPLSRPLFIYVSTQALEENQSVEEFVNFYLENVDQFVEQARYVPTSAAAKEEATQRLQNLSVGSDPQGAVAGEPKGSDEEKGKEKTK